MFNSIERRLIKELIKVGGYSRKEATQIVAIISSQIDYPPEEHLNDWDLNKLLES